ncbi:hypothetical protein EDB84DRAFT_1532514 [Lactarius hengduanensis]|nr:hypothetical protein EDB84DRAFT_1532514 [Lactarius hengduanensis]
MHLGLVWYNSPFWRRCTINIALLSGHPYLSPRNLTGHRDLTQLLRSLSHITSHSRFTCCRLVTSPKAPTNTTIVTVRLVATFETGGVCVCVPTPVQRRSSRLQCTITALPTRSLYSFRSVVLMLLAGCRNPLVGLTLVVVRNSAADNFRGRRIARCQRRRLDLLPNSDQTVLHRRQGKADLGSCPSNKSVPFVSQDAPCASWLFRRPRGLRLKLRLARNRF